jgi:hypothetical protein
MILLHKVLAGTADNVLPEVLFDVTTDADETGKCEKCTNNKEYWVDHKPMCKDIGCKYSGGGGGDMNKSTCRRNKCLDNKEYHKSHRTCCHNKGYEYEPHGPTYGKHKCEDNINGYWDNNKAWCKRHGWCPDDYKGQCDGRYKDAKIIADILTGVYDDENFQVEDFQDEDFQDEDFKDDPEESQDE